MISEGAAAIGRQAHGSPMGGGLTSTPGDAAAAPGGAPLDGLMEQYQQHERRVYRLCVAYLRDAAAAEDALQETFIRAAPRLVGMDEGRAGRFLLLVARSICIDALRRRTAEAAAQARLGSSEETSPDPAVSAEEGMVVRAVWEHLGERERLLFVYRFAGYTHDEIGARLTMSPGAVSMALTRARRRARILLDGFGGTLAAVLAGLRRRSPRGGRSHALRTARRLGAVHRLGGRLMLLLVTAGAGTGIGFAASHAPGPMPSADVSARGVLATTGDGPVITDITVSPQAGRDRTLFASGHRARGCTAALCPVLQVSHDDGHAWTALPATGFAGGRILLPPAFPRDPLIYASGLEGLQQSGDGGRSFHTVVGVPGPAAVVTWRGGTRIVIGGTPLWSYDLASRQLDTGPAMPPGMIEVDDLRATGDGAVLVVGTRVDRANPARRDRVAVRCDDRGCLQVIAIPDDNSPLQLPPLPSVAGAAAVFSRTALFVSADGGRSFTAAQVGRGRVAAVAPRRAGSEVQVVALMAAGDGSTMSLLVVDAAGRLRAAVPSVTLPRAVGWLAALSDGHLIVGLAQTPAATWQGLACSADSGWNWGAC